MSYAPTACPKCKSADIRCHEERNDWFCNDCEHRWTNKVRLFLSYGRRDARELADQLYVDLTAAGYEVWRDTQEIASGTIWEQEIRDGLRSTQIMIAVLSPHAVRLAADPDNPDKLDGVCLDEISFARFGRPAKPIVPVMAVPCETPFSIFRLDYVDLTCWRESKGQYQIGLSRLLEGIEAGLNNEPRFRAWEQKLRPWDFAGYLNEKRRGFVGREWLFDRLEAWRTSGRARVLLITGDPGTGKSAIVAQLVHHGSRVLAYHCCRGDDRETLAPWRFIRSVAAMIAARVPDYAAQLDDPEVDAALSEASCRTNAVGSFDRGILTPLQRLSAPDDGGRYLLVDALDESLLHQGSCNLVDLLAARWKELPDWLRIVATTRPSPDVLKQLSGLPAEQLDAHDPRSLSDVDHYIRQRLGTPDLAARLVQLAASAKDACRMLRERCDGNFLYAQQALDGMETGQFQLDRLSDLPPGLYGLYFELFRRHFPDAASYDLPRRLLQVVVAACEPLTEHQLAAASGLNARSDLATVLRRLRVYLPPREGDDGEITYALYHKSLADWLVDDRQRGDLHYCDPISGHECLAEACLKEYRQGSRAMSRYALAYLPSHLIKAQDWDALEDVLEDVEFISARCEREMTMQTVEDFDLAFQQRSIGCMDRARVDRLSIFREFCVSIHQVTVGQYEDAESVMRRVLPAFEELSDARASSYASFHQARMLEYQGKLNAAETCYQRLVRSCGLRAASATTSEFWRLLEAKAYHQLGNICEALHKPDEARKYLQESISRHEELGDIERSLSGRRILAHLYRDEGRLAQARGVLEDCRALARQHGLRRSEAYTQHQLGGVSLREHRLEDAGDRYGQSLSFAEKHGDLPLAASSRRGLAEVAFAEGDVVESRKRFAEALETSRRINDRVSLAGTCRKWAVMESELGDRQAAAEKAREAIRLAEELGNTALAAGMHGLAELTVDQDDE